MQDGFVMCGLRFVNLLYILTVAEHCPGRGRPKNRRVLSAEAFYPAYPAENGKARHPIRADDFPCFCLP